jgi:hypothetical protein
MITTGAFLKLSWKYRRHVVTCRHDTTCRSNFGQMGPCRRHKIEDVVAVCAGSSRHFPDFPKCVCRNILWYGSTYTQILSRTHIMLSTLISVMFSSLSCSPHETKITTTLLNTTASTTAPCPTAPSTHASYKGYVCNNAKPSWPPHRNTMIDVVVLGCGPIRTGEGAAAPFIGVHILGEIRPAGGLLPWPNRNGRTKLDRLS